MANNYFQFKQFTIWQERVAMKVGTDGVLIGAWANLIGANSILDIGSGTGLLALMAAQRNNTAIIDAVEIDREAFFQSEINVRESRWNERICMHNMSIQEFVEKSDRKYDYIISNPPYFENSLKSDCDKRNLARHTSSLSFEELFFNATSLLNSSGIFGLIVPISVECRVAEIAKGLGLYLKRMSYVYPTPEKGAKRLLLEYSYLEYQPIIDRFVIEIAGRHNYSTEYINLLKDFYLKL